MIPTGLYNAVYVGLHLKPSAFAKSIEYTLWFLEQIEYTVIFWIFAQIGKGKSSFLHF
jgi:hypothetical protein